MFESEFNFSNMATKKERDVNLIKFSNCEAVKRVSGKYKRNGSYFLIKLHYGEPPIKIESSIKLVELNYL